MDRFRTKHTLVDNTHPQRRRTVRNKEAVAAEERSIEVDPNEAIGHRAQQLELCPSTLWQILRKDLGYKIQLVHELKPHDHRVRRTFGEWIENEISLDPHVHHKILISDEAHFWLIRYINKQNFRIQSEENPQAIIKTPLHSQSLFGVLYWRSRPPPIYAWSKFQIKKI